MIQISPPYMTTGKTIALNTWICAGKVMSLLSNMLSRFAIAFLPRSKHFCFFVCFFFCLFVLISWLQSPSALILEPKKIRSVTVSIVSHIFAMKWWDQMPWSSFFECWVLSQVFHSPLSLSSRGSLVPFHFLPLGLCHLHIWGYWYFAWQYWFQLVLHPAQRFTVYSVYKLSKQGDSIQRWCTTFSVWNQSIVACLILTVPSWPAYRFLRRQVRWSGIPISLRIFHTSTQSKALA